MNPEIQRVDGTSVLDSEAALPEAATRNACKLCAPLGAAWVYKGVRGCLPFLHGSQGCATYIRRYMISHFREPVDIASSSFSEDDAIFGGARNFREGLDNVVRQYDPELIGVATTCLAETIGENMIGMIRDYQEDKPAGAPPLVHVSTPAYAGSHSDGYRATQRALVDTLTEPASAKDESAVNVLPSMMSCEDLRYLRKLCHCFGLKPTLLPDYSETLEGELWGAYHRISPGGTPVDAIAKMGAAKATLEFGHALRGRNDTAGGSLETKHGVSRRSLGWPLGVQSTDEMLDTLSEISGREIPSELYEERGRLVDSYVDAHKYVSGRKAVVFGEPDLVIALAAFLSEIGILPVVCGTGAKLKGWGDLLRTHIPDTDEAIEALAGADHAKIAARARAVKPDLLIGSSKGYPLARELGIPLVRVGFPIHDRFGAQRDLTVGYRGTQTLFDRIVNALLAARQDGAAIEYSYL